MDMIVRSPHSISFSVFGTKSGLRSANSPESNWPDGWTSDRASWSTRSMSNNEFGGDSSDGAKCPTCGGVYANEAGVRIHHSKTHGERLPQHIVHCAWCGKEKEVFKSELEKYDHHFCPKSDCYGRWRSENITGESHPLWEGGKILSECSWCGGDLELTPSLANDSKNHFCTDECHRDWKSHSMMGEKHPRWIGGLTAIQCAWCGDEREVTRHQARTTEYNFCSGTNCYGKWRSENLVGENHPRWNGGDMGYGPGWDEAKREFVRERDGRVCQNPGCGRTEKEHVELFGKKHSVHHIQKARTFDDSEKRNHPDNLIILCQTRECHYRWEQMSPLRPEIVGDD